MACPGRDDDIENYVRRHPDRHVLMVSYAWGQTKARVAKCSMKWVAAVLRSAE
jgi:hypothetical protein